MNTQINPSNKTSKIKGFTLLELLLVVGIAALLIVAGISTYSIVSKTNMINDTVTLANTILQQTRQIALSDPTYATTTNYETALINTGSIQQRHIVSGAIQTPGMAPNAANVVIGGNGAGLFTLEMLVQGRTAPEIAQNFDPRSDDNLTQVTACGVTILDTTPTTTLSTAAAFSAAGGGCVGTGPTMITLISR